jgi:RHS repeat-associated protein
MLRESGRIRALIWQMPVEVGGYQPAASVRLRVEESDMPSCKRKWTVRLAVLAWSIIAVLLMPLPATAQLAPVMGAHYAGRSSDTGFKGAVNSLGGYGLSVPLDLPAARGGLPVPVQVVYGGNRVGAAGLGWDVPLSYVFRSATIAHRRPKPGPFFSVTVPTPINPPVEYSVMLSGERVELVRNAADTAWVGRRGNTQLEVRANGDAAMVMYDGEGRTYSFSAQGGSAGSRLVGGDLYLLTDISALGNTVHFSYTIGAPVMPNGNTALSINVANVSYNKNPTTAGCFKNKVQLNYDAPATGNPPLSMSIFNSTVLTRVQKLISIDVISKLTCADSGTSLRKYTLAYQSDADTQRPQLQKVTVVGQQGTPERSVTLPVATYTYGTVTDTTGHITYQKQSIDLQLTPPLISYGISYTSAFSRADGHVDLFTPQNLVDLNGDGRPDLRSDVGVFRNTPGANGTTVLRREQGAFFNFSEKSTTTDRTPRDSSGLTLSDDKLINQVDVWKQYIDMNGDGRMDFVEADVRSDSWVIHLNMPDPADPNKSVDVIRTISTTPMRQALNHPRFRLAENQPVPIARITSVQDTTFNACWVWVHDLPADHWNQQLPSECPFFPPDVIKPEKTITEWTLKDINGDGYPDFIYNESAVLTARDPFFIGPPTTPGTVFGEHAITQTPVDIAGSREVMALINTIGVHLANGTDFAFASPIPLLVGGPDDGCGVERWQTTPDAVSSGVLSQICGFEDINGDGIADRITSVVQGPQFVSRTALGTGDPNHPYSADATITLPGPLARVDTDLVGPDGDGKFKPRACSTGIPGSTYDVQRTRGLRDINGDGIPDYVVALSGEWAVYLGTRTGFTPTGFFPPTSVNSPVGMELSLEKNLCSIANVVQSGEGSIRTPIGLYDLDGDGQPEIVAMNFSTLKLDVYQLRPPVDQVDVGPVAGVPASGRLTKIDNGYGAITRIGYKSAKEDTQSAHNVPYPEIVVTAVATTDTSTAGLPLESTIHYAYRDAGLIFDPAYDAFIFPGYQRTVELRATSEETPDASVATFTDTYGLAPFDPAMDITARFQRYLLAGRVKDVTTLSGRLGTDPWALGIGDISTSIFRTAGAHYDWDARLLTTGPTPSPASNELCLDMMYPYDFGRSQSNGGFAWEDECTKHGFLFQKAVSSWRGDPGTGDPFTSSSTVKSKTDIKSVDDFGRTITVALLNDSSRSDDDLCVRTVYATPMGTNERVLSAPASRTVTADSCDDATAVALMSEKYEYDTSATGIKLPAGSVSAALPTSAVISRRNADTGALIADASGVSDIRTFDARYDNTNGVLTSVTIAREDGASQTTSVTYDAFLLTPLTATNAGTNAGGTTLPSTTTTVTADPLTLNPLIVTTPNGTQSGNTYDGFGRVLLSSVKPPTGPAGVLSSMIYNGFAVGQTGGRRIVRKVFTDPVDPASWATAVGRTGATFLDALGRATRTEVALGADYANKVMVLGETIYDKIGRVKFVADPHLSTDSFATAYGTTRFFNTDGTPSCFVRGNGPQGFTTATDEANERYPTCVSRYFRMNREFVDTQDAASRLPGSPQAGVVQESTYSAIGQLLERATYGSDPLTGNLMATEEDALFGYDRLGHLVRMMRRYQVPQSTIAVATTWHYDNLGRVIELEEPGAAPQCRSYDRWGELTQVQWTDTTTSPSTDRRSLTTYDARGRVTHSEDQTNLVAIPETVKDFVYDQGVNNVTPPVTATNTLGRLAKATSPTSSVSVSYDAFGHINAQVFTDRTATSNNVYVEKRDYHGDGSLQALHLLLPDTAFKDEKFDYAYDSAGRMRLVKYADGMGSLALPLINFDTIDPFGRIRQARIGLLGFNGPASYSATYAETGRRLLHDERVTSATGAASREISYQPVAGTTGSVTAFDPLGRERVRKEFTNGTAAPVKVSDYDNLGRLTAASLFSSSVLTQQRAFTYDPLGNLIAQSDPTGQGSPGAVTMSYQSTDHDRICSIAYGTATPPPPTCNVKYDGVGNVIEEPSRSTGARTLTYFPSGQVKSIVNGSTNATFDYDAFGAVQRLVLNSPTAADTRHDKHFGALIAVRDETTNGNTTIPVITRTIPSTGVSATRHGPSGPWIFAMGEQRGNRFFVEAGDFVQDVSYQPYGEATSEGQPPRSAHYSSKQWNGGDALAALGLSQLGARMYDPVIGRFLSRDPLLIPRTAATTNPYAFADNDPVNHSDPTGLQEKDPTGLPTQCDPSVCGSSGPGNLGGLVHSIECIFADCGPPKPEPHTSTTSSGSPSSIFYAGYPLNLPPVNDFEANSSTPQGPQSDKRKAKENEHSSLYNRLNTVRLTLQIGGPVLKYGVWFAASDAGGDIPGVLGKLSTGGEYAGYAGDALSILNPAIEFARNPSLGGGAEVVYRGLKVGIARGFGIPGKLVSGTLTVGEQAGLIGPGVWNPTDRAIRRLEAWGQQEAEYRDWLLADRKYFRELTYERYKNDVCVAPEPVCELPVFGPQEQ